MRLIDADKLIEEYALDSEMDLFDMLSYRPQAIIDRINGQPTVNEWILVSERLPKEYGEYWIRTKHRYGVAKYLMCPKKWVDDDGDVYGVIAWKPIEPYIGDKE